MQEQKVDLYRPIASARVGAPPIVIRVNVTYSADSFAGGVPSSSVRSEPYVLLSALPEELRNRVALAVQALVAGQ